MKLLEINVKTKHSALLHSDTKNEDHTQCYDHTEVNTPRVLFLKLLSESPLIRAFLFTSNII